jgi:hypothetical protein
MTYCLVPFRSTNHYYDSPFSGHPHLYKIDSKTTSSGRNGTHIFHNANQAFGIDKGRPPVGQVSVALHPESDPGQETSHVQAYTTTDIREAQFPRRCDESPLPRSPQRGDGTVVTAGRRGHAQQLDLHSVRDPVRVSLPGPGPRPLETCGTRPRDRPDGDQRPQALLGAHRRLRRCTASSLLGSHRPTGPPDGAADRRTPRRRRVMEGASESCWSTAPRRRCPTRPAISAPSHSRAPRASAGVSRWSGW